jgi:hypothetical protein
MADTGDMKLRTMIAARAAQKELERELSTYNSPADRNDLDAILDRHSEEQAADIRRIVAGQRAEQTQVPQPRRA